jgi:histone H3/H4
MKNRFEDIDELHRDVLDKIIKKYGKDFSAEYIEILYNEIRNITQEISGYNTPSVYMTKAQTIKALKVERLEKKLMEKQNHFRTFPVSSYHK